VLTGVVWTRGGVKIPNAKKNPRRPEPKYEVVIAEVDELVIEILDRAGRNPKVFVLSISGDARAARPQHDGHEDEGSRNQTPELPGATHSSLPVTCTTGLSVAIVRKAWLSG
jgi:hypothetical protein